MPQAFPSSSKKLSPLLSQILAKRGLTSGDEIQVFLKAGLADLYDPFRMHGMREAVERIYAAIKENQKILIHGDYDVDGVTGAAIVAHTLTFLNADFETFLPDRSEDGYGISQRAIENAAARGFRLLVTVDCGVAAYDAIELARKKGLDVIIIDHHRIGDRGLPPANIILNPLQEACQYEFSELSAGGLAFKLSQALIGEGAFRLLDLVTLSTVCDVAPLIDENRILVREGLKVLAGRKNLGLAELAKTAKIRSKEINVGHVGFMLGPRINAAGRMSSPDIALRLLMTDSLREAVSLAKALDEENKVRQREERQVLKQAIHEVERSFNFSKERVIVVGRDGWHAGVIGIVAARLVEKYHRPAIVIAFENKMGKGSGRSVKGFHLFDAMNHCKGDLVEFGGHELAAGCSIQEENFQAFRTRINQYAASEISAEAFVRKTYFDLEIGFESITPGVVDELELLEPHGAGNPRPLFKTTGLRLKGSAKQISSDYFALWVTGGGKTLEALWRNRQGRDTSWLRDDASVELIYAIKSKSWDGIRGVVLEIRDGSF